MILELNIRLDIAGRRNSMADCNERAAMTLRMLDRTFAHLEARRHDVQVEHPTLDLIEMQHNLIVRIKSALPAWTTFEVLEELVEALEQDCIAIYEPATGKGELFGPRWDQWPDFNLDLFVRFDTLRFPQYMS